MGRKGQAAPSGAHEDSLDVVVIGAGFAGLYAVHKLRSLGFSVRGFERGEDVGGVWYWNRYPGARCDCESYYYSYSFSDPLQQEWRWTQRYPEQPEILSYLSHVAERFDLRRSFAFGTGVTRMAFDEAAEEWLVETDRGESLRTRFVIAATGCISAVQKPDWPGFDAFAGEILYTARWPHEPVELRGRRVGIIGTGASGVQAIPILAREAAHLTVFQRTPNFVLPARNAALEPEWEAWVRAHYDEIRARCLASPGAVPWPGVDRLALATPAEEREAIYRRVWELGGLRFFVETFADLITDEAANATAADFVRARIRETVADPAVAEALSPRDHFIGTKRPPLGDDYYAAYNRPNVRLVDLRATPIIGLDKTGVLTSAEHFPIDLLVLATGFDAMTGALSRIDIRGRDGARLAEKWAAGAQSYLGLGIAGFPNLFTVTGPLSPSVVANMPTGVEQHVDWIGDCLAHLREKGLATIEPIPEAEAAWVEHAAQVAGATLYPRVDSWYMGANIPGKARRFQVYLGGFSAYRARCLAIAQAGYEGFRLAAGKSGADRHATGV